MTNKDKFYIEKARFDSMLAELKAWSNDDFNCDPDTVNPDVIMALQYITGEMGKVSNIVFRRFS